MAQVSPAGYDPALFDAIAAAERRHFWFRARNRVLEAVLSPLGARMAAGTRALEIGCGTGNTLRVLSRACPRATVVGMDLFAEGFRHAAQGRARLVQGRLEQSPFRTRFDLVGLFDVLEHIEDDRQALESIRLLLEPGGHLVLTVPAGPHLWSAFDTASHHWRRYTRDELQARLEGAGFELRYMTPFMTASYPALWLARKLRSRARSQVERPDDAILAELAIPGWLNAVLDLALRPEGVILRAGGRLPVGTSLLAVASTPGQSDSLAP